MNQQSALWSDARNKKNFRGGISREESKSHSRKHSRISAAAPLITLLLAAYVSGCSDKKAPKPATHAAPQRIVTLTPTATELVFALGAGQRVVGVDRYSTYPEEARDLPKVGDFLSPSFSEIARLKPDLIIADALQSKVSKSLGDAGYRVLTLEMHTVKDVLTGIDMASKSLGDPSAGQRLRRLIEEGLDEAKKQLPPVAQRPGVLLVLDRESGGLGGIVAAGAGSYADEIILAAGGRNVLADSKVRYPRISAEVILRSDPAVILDGAHEGRNVADWQALPQVAAVKANRVHGIGNRAFTAPSPRVGQAVDEMRALLYPKQPK